jgi:Family of unknown function (DUF6247)
VALVEAGQELDLAPVHAVLEHWRMRAWMTRDRARTSVRCAVRLSCSPGSNRQRTSPSRSPRPGYDQDLSNTVYVVTTVPQAPAEFAGRRGMITVTWVSLVA